MERLDSEITVHSGSFSGLPMTIPFTGVGTSSTAASPSYAVAPSSSWPSNEPSSSSIAGLSDSQSSFSDAAASFFANKGAVAGVFTGLGLLLVSLCAIIYIGWIRNRKKHTIQPRNTAMIRADTPDTFPDYKVHLGANLDSKPSKLSSRTGSSHYVSLASITHWWNRRTGPREILQFRGTFHHSRSPSVFEESKDVGEEDTQWTLGKVLEDQKQQVIMPLPPVPRAPSRHGRLPSRGLGVRGSSGSGEGEGARFTLEDALLPSLSSSPTGYELGSNSKGRHPYAQA